MKNVPETTSYEKGEKGKQKRKNRVEHNVDGFVDPLVEVEVKSKNDISYYDKGDNLSSGRHG